jgi:stage II sporulation protein D
MVNMARRFAVCAACVLSLAGAAAGQAVASTMLVIDGAGFGHGVGMSQYGAYGLALHGSDYRTILAHYYSHTALATIPNRVIRVLLMSGRGSVTVSGATAVGARRLNPATTYTARMGGGRVVLTANGRTAATASGALALAGKSPLRVGGTALNGIANGRYRGRIEFDANGEVINQLRLEDYVRGVVAAESISSWPLAELEAQAVATRTFAITSGYQQGFDVYADTRSQQYGGVSAETASTDKATAATAGQVVTYNGKPVITYFFDTSGGATEDVQYGFPGSSPEPWLLGVPDPYDSLSPDHRWGPIRLTLAQAQSALGANVRGTLRAITVTKRGYSPRVVSATIVGSGGSTTVDGPTLAGAFGLKSTWACFAVTDSSGTPLPGWDDPCQGLSTPSPGTGAGTGGGTPAP